MQKNSLHDTEQDEQQAPPRWGGLWTSIRLRLTLSHLAVIVVAMGLSGGLLLSWSEQYFIRALERNLIAQAQIVAQALLPGSQTVGPQSTGQAAVSNTLRQQRVDNIQVETWNLDSSRTRAYDEPFDLTYLFGTFFELSTQLDTRIRLLDVQGVVVVDSAQEEPGDRLGDEPLVAQALSGRYASRVARPGPVLGVAVPVMVDGQLAAVVYLEQPLRDLAAVLSNLRLRWWGATAVALVLSGVFGALLSRAIARPVRGLTTAAKAVAQGELDQQVPVRSRDELGQLSRAFNDMTARLRAAYRAQVALVANVSHELRTPLTAVKGLVETLRDGAIEDREVRDRFLETIEGETNRLIRLVNDLLLLSRVDSDALCLKRELTDVVALIQATVEQLDGRAEALGLSVCIQAAPDVPMAWADPDRVTQVLLNLLDNALKYSNPGGIVSIVVEQAGHTVQIQVQDQGIGIPAEALPHVGERFYRVDKARARVHGGSGLGLAIARALVEAHGGQLHLASQERSGTTVTFTLPTA